MVLGVCGAVCLAVETTDCEQRGEMLSEGTARPTRQSKTTTRLPLFNKSAVPFVFSFRSSFFFFFFFRVGGCGGNFSSYILTPPPSTRRISPHPSPTLPYAVLHPPPPAFPPPAFSTRESTTGSNAYFPFRSPRLRSTVYEDANPFKDVPFFLLPRCFILSNLRFSCRFFP